MQSIFSMSNISSYAGTHIGACQALYQELDDCIGLIHTRKWLELGKDAKEYVLKNFSNTLTQEEIYRKTERISILYQLQNLLTYPEVKKRIEQNELEIHGWYYRIEDGTIETYNQQNDRFEMMDYENFMDKSEK